MKLTPPALSLIVLFSSSSSLAGEWIQDAGVSVGSYYSDNICLVRQNEEGKVVGTITPRADIRREGDRASVSLQAAAEFNTIGNSSLECPERGEGGGGLNPANRESFIPRLNFLSEVELVEDLVYLEADAFAAQNPLNPFAPGGEDNINATGNQNVTYRWGAGARLQRQFSSEWSLLARYNYNEQFNSFNQVLGDSQEDRFEFDAGKIPGVSRFSYGIRGQYSEITFEESVTQPEFTNRLSSVELRGALQLSSDLQLNGYAGQEDNVFLSNDEDIDGAYWDVGVRWSPNVRVVVEAGYGERFFGETPRLNVSYRHKRSQLEASYLRDFVFPRNIRSANGGSDPDDPFTPILGDPGDPLVSGGDLTVIGQGPVLNERFTLGYVFTGRRTTVSLSASDSLQTRAANGQQAEFIGAGITVRRRYARRLSVDVGVNWRKNEGIASDLPGGGGFVQNLESWRGTLGVVRSLTENTSVSLRYRYTDQTTGQSVNTFIENRAEVSFNHSF